MSDKKLTSKEYLSRAFRVEQRINNKLEQVQALRALAEKTASILLCTANAKNASPHRMGEAIAKMVDLEAEINIDIKSLVDLKTETVTVIKCVKPIELRTLLEMRYLNFKTWEQIADDMGYDLRWVYRLHGKALSEVDVIRHC